MKAAWKRSLKGIKSQEKFGKEEKMQGPVPEQQIKVDQQLVQKRIEDQLGGLMIQLCIMYAIIETLQAELNSIKLGVVQPNSFDRPVTGQNEAKH